METISRQILIECLVAAQIGINHQLFERLCKSFNAKFNNHELAELMFGYTGIFIYPKTSTIFEYN